MNVLLKLPVSLILHEIVEDHLNLKDIAILQVACANKELRKYFKSYNKYDDITHANPQGIFNGILYREFFKVHNFFKDHAIISCNHYVDDIIIDWVCQSNILLRDIVLSSARISTDCIHRNSTSLLRINKHIKNISYCGYDIDSNLMESIGLFLSHFHSIEYIDVKATCENHVITLIEQFPTLLTLKIRPTELKVSDIALVAIGNHCRSLRWMDIGLADNETGNGLVTIANNCKNLRSVSIQFKFETSTLIDNITYLLNCSNIRELYLGVLSSQRRIFDAIESKPNQYRCMKLSLPENMDESFVNICSTQNMSLTALKVEWPTRLHNFASDSVFVSISNLRMLTSLYLKGCNFPAMTNYMSYILQRLEHLHTLTVQGFTEFSWIEVITISCLRLEALHILSPTFQSKSYDDSFNVVYESISKSLCQLKVLKFSAQVTNSIPQRAIPMILERHGRSLHELTMWICNKNWQMLVDNDGMIMALDAMYKDCYCLRSVHFLVYDVSNISNHLQLLVKILNNNRRLKVFKLGIKDEVVRNKLREACGSHHTGVHMDDEETSEKSRSYG